VGLLTIAMGCRKLRHFRASDLPSVTEAVLLAVAAHCPEMAILTFDRCAKLTDGVLLALSASCPKLRELQCDDWAVISVDTVDAAQPLLSRLIHFPINSVHEANLATMTRAAALMSNVAYFSLRDLSPADIAALSRCPVPALKYISLINGSGVVVAVDELVVAMVAGSQQIASISLYGGCTISEATLLTLATLRPGVVELDVEFVSGEVTESTLITLIRSWPKLHSIMICRNRPITDAVLRAIATHGVYLSTLSLSANTIVSEAAVLELAEFGCLTSLRPPAIFTQAAQQRVRNACAVGKR
jgi:hypothetical protein